MHDPEEPRCHTTAGLHRGLGAALRVSAESGRCSWTTAERPLRGLSRSSQHGEMGSEGLVLKNERSRTDAPA